MPSLSQGFSDDDYTSARVAAHCGNLVRAVLEAARPGGPDCLCSLLCLAIPIIGPIIGGIPIVLLAVMLPSSHGGGLALALKVLIFFSLLHLFESKLPLLIKT